MALTGLFLCSFLVVHLLGNIALYIDPRQFNEYTRFMSSNPLIRVMEIILVAGFLVHIIDAVMLVGVPTVFQEQVGSIFEIAVTSFPYELLDLETIRQLCR